MASNPARRSTTDGAPTRNSADAGTASARHSSLTEIKERLQVVRDRYAGMQHQPLHIRARLLRPLALNDAILFDGLLRAAVVKEYAPCQALAGMPVPDGLHVPLPLAYSLSKRSYPFASLGYADAAAEVVLRPGHRRLLEYAVTWHKTWEHSGDNLLVFQSDNGKPLRGKISLGGAQYKGWAMRLSVIDWREAHFWCRGNADEVVRLLANIPAVGKKQAWGFGLVAPGGWTVEECAQDWSERGPRGQPTRPLPILDHPDRPPHSSLAHAAYRSPAYDARDWCDVWVPE